MIQRLLFCRLFIQFSLKKKARATNRALAVVLMFNAQGFFLNGFQASFLEVQERKN